MIPFGFFGGGGGVGFDFRAGAMPDGVTHSRASKAWGFDASQALVEYANDAPAWDYSSGTLRGLLLEPARGNEIRNPTLTGGSAPSTLPTNMSVTNTTGLTLTQAYSTVAGLPVMDLRLVGTATVSAQIVVQFETATGIPVTPGGAYSLSLYIAQTAGDMTGVSVVRLALDNLKSDGSRDRLDQGSDFKASLTTGLSRFEFAGTHSSLAAFGRPSLRITTISGVAADATLRCAVPQFEKAATRSSPILAASRAANSLVLAIPDGIYQRRLRMGTVSAGGTVYQDAATVSGGAGHTLDWAGLPSAAQSAGQRHIQHVLLRRIG